VWVSRHQSVAIKLLRGSRADLERECAFLQSLSHRHIISLLGVCVSESGQQMIVTDWMEHGSLSEYMRQCKASGVRITPQQRLQWSTQCIQSINHMHLLTPQVLHRDIKCANYLVDKSLDIKLGTSRRAPTRVDRSTSAARALECATSVYA
jgi:serine/threonine protein kinase